MGSEWEIHRLDELTDLIVDCPHSTPEWTTEGEIVLRSQNIRGGRLDLSFPSYTTAEGYQSRIKRAVPTTDDIILTREAPMGEVCLLPSGLKCCMGQRMVLIRTNKHRLVPKYLLYLFQSPFLQHQIGWNEGTGTTVSNIRIPMIAGFNIPLPPLPEQKAIAHILGSLDDKIELNRKMNQTLEAMAQALFKSWFVDFDPVIDNALVAGNPIPDEFAERAEIRRQALANGTANREVAKDFPAGFRLTEEMGWVPEGWEVREFGFLLEDTVGGDWGKELEDSKHTVPTAIIRGTDMPQVVTGNCSAVPRRWVEPKKFFARQLRDSDIVIEISGGSPTQSTGRSLLITDNIIHRLGGNVEPASFCRKFRPKNATYGLYGALHLSFIYKQGKMWEYQNQSTGISNFQTSSFLEREYVVLPSKAVILEKLDKVIRPYFNRITDDQQEMIGNLRDMLLPKLMAGAICITENIK